MQGLKDKEHSILDIRRFYETSPYAGFPLSEEVIRDFFVHEAVTKEVIETIVTAKEVWSGVQNVIDHQIRTRKSVPQFLRKNLLSEEVLQFFEVTRTIQELIRDLYEQKNIWNELHELVVSLIKVWLITTDIMSPSFLFLKKCFSNFLTL